MLEGRNGIGNTPLGNQRLPQSDERIHHRRIKLGSAGEVFNRLREVSILPSYLAEHVFCPRVARIDLQLLFEFPLGLLLRRRRPGLGEQQSANAEMDSRR